MQFGGTRIFVNASKEDPYLIPTARGVHMLMHDIQGDCNWAEGCHCTVDHAPAACSARAHVGAHAFAPAHTGQQRWAGLQNLTLAAAGGYDLSAPGPSATQYMYFSHREEPKILWSWSEERQGYVPSHLFNVVMAGGGTKTNWKSMDSWVHAQPLRLPSDFDAPSLKTEDEATEVPHLNGIFLSLSERNANFTAVQWRAEFEAMKAVKIEFFAIRSVLSGRNSYTTGGCTLGHFESFYNSTMRPPGCYKQVGSTAPGGTLGVILEQAQAVGLGVHFGGLMSSVRFRGPGGKTPAGVVQWYRDLAGLQVECARDVWKQFPQHHSVIKGFYADLEVNNLPDWYRSAKDLSRHYLNPIAEDVKKLSPHLKVWASPYAVYNYTLHNRTDAREHGQLLNATEYARFWGGVLTAAPAFDFIAPQDSVGWMANTLPEVAASLTALGAASAQAKPPRELWSNVELFEGWPAGCWFPTACGRHPASIARITSQIGMESRLATKLIAWSWGELSPSGFASNSSGRLYKQYAKYLGGGTRPAVKADDQEALGSDVWCSNGTILHSNRSTTDAACEGQLGAECGYGCDLGYLAIGRHVCQSYAQGGMVFLDRQWFGGRCKRLCAATARPCAAGLVPSRINSSDAAGPCFATTCSTADNALRKLAVGNYALWQLARNNMTGIYIAGVDLKLPPERQPFQQGATGETGLGLTFECVADAMGWVSRGQAQASVLLTLRSLSGLTPGFTLPQNRRGFVPTFIDSNTGAVWGNTTGGQGFAVMSTDLLHAGIMFVKTYFERSDPGSANTLEISTLASALFKGVQWDSLLCGDLGQIDPNGTNIPMLQDWANGCSALMPLRDGSYEFNEEFIAVNFAYQTACGGQPAGRCSNVGIQRMWTHWQARRKHPIYEYGGRPLLSLWSAYVVHLPYYMVHAFNSDPTGLYTSLFNSHYEAEWSFYKSSMFHAGEDGRFGLGAGPVNKSCACGARYVADLFLPVSSQPVCPTCTHGDHCRIYSPSSVAGYMPSNPDTVKAQILALLAVGESVYGLAGSDHYILWRKSLLDPSWTTADEYVSVTTVDVSSELFGLSTLWLGADFYQNNTNHWPKAPLKADDEDTYSIDNTRPRTDTDGKIVNAHQGHITQFPDGRWYWVGSAWVPCDLQQGIDGCHVGTTRHMNYGACGFNNNNISIYSNSKLTNGGWALETDDALPRATRLVGEYWQPNFEYNPATRLFVMWWIYSKPNTTVGLVQSGTSPRPGGPYTIANGNVTLAHKSFTSAELFIDRDPSLPATSTPAAYLIYSSVNPGHQAATVVDRLDTNWTSSAGQSSRPFGAGEGQVMLRWGSGSSKIYYVLAGSTGGCCFCPMGANTIAWRASSPLGPFTQVGNINQCLEDCHPVNGECSVCCPGSQSCPRHHPPPSPAPPPAPSHILAVGPISAQRKAGGGVCLVANTSAACVPHGHELPPGPAGSGSQCPVRVEPCTDSAEQQWRVTSTGQLISNVTGACADAAHGSASQDVYSNFCVGTTTQPAPIGQTWNVSLSDSAGELRLIASGTCVALGELGSTAIQMAACGQPGSTDHTWRLPSRSNQMAQNELPPTWLRPAWTVPGQQQGVTALPGGASKSSLPGCEGGVMMWSGDAWQHAPDGRKEHDPQWWVPLCFDAHGNMQNLTMAERWKVDT